MKQFSLGTGVIALLIGLFLFVHPFTTTAMIGWFIALLVFLTGITSLFLYFAANGQRSVWYLVQSIISIVFGFILLTSSAMALSSTVMLVTSYWLLVSGIFRLIASIQMRRAGFFDANRFLGSALLAIVLGLFLLFNPVLSAIFVGRLVGLMLMAAGVSGIMLALSL